MTIRDFSTIKTREDATDALVGAKVVSMENNRLVFETIAGERFAMHMYADPLECNIGPMAFKVAVGQIKLKFTNEV